MTDLILLATLLDGPKHGYQLKKQAGLIFGQGAIHNNLVYPLMRRFTNNGWVTKKTVAGERGQNKQQYALTAAGRSALIERLSDFDDEAARSADGFRIRVALLGILPEETQEKILSTRKIALRGLDARMGEIEKAVELSVYPGEVLKFMREQMAGEIAWVRRLQKLRARHARNHSARRIRSNDGSARREATRC